MKQTLVKFRTSDGLELAGILYEPLVSSSKIVIHVHGLSSSFYRSKFLEKQAKMYTDNGYAFLTFNNRGNNIVFEMNNKLYGSAYENFNESSKDIEAAIGFVDFRGYSDIILQGHSYGCNKVVNYAYNNNVMGLILLAPTDVTGILRNIPAFEESIMKCNELIESGRGDTLVNGFGQVFTASSVITNFMENSEADIFRYRTPSYQSHKLVQIVVPTLVLIGDLDKLALTKDKLEINEFFTNNIKEVDVFFVDEADHSFRGSEDIVAENCYYFLSDKF